MTQEAQELTGLDKITDTVAKFTAVVSRRLPDDVTGRITTLAEQERQPMALMIYDTMKKNQELAGELKRPSCQDTGLVQIFAQVGSHFPYMDGPPGSHGRHRSSRWRPSSCS